MIADFFEQFTHLNKII